MYENFKTLRRNAVRITKSAKYHHYKECFSNSADNRKKWSTIKSIGIGNKFSSDNNDNIDVDELNTIFTKNQSSRINGTPTEIVHAKNDGFEFQRFTEADVLPLVSTI